jgi:hypothetical protein
MPIDLVDSKVESEDVLQPIIENINQANVLDDGKCFF